MALRTRWLHTDNDCPRRPWFGRRAGRRYRCTCGRVWEARWRDTALAGWWYWVLVP